MLSSSRHELCRATTVTKRFFTATIAVPDALHLPDSIWRPPMAERMKLESYVLLPDDRRAGHSASAKFKLATASGGEEGIRTLEAV